MLSPLPIIGHAYSMLMQDEKQREVYVNSQFPGDSSFFLAGLQDRWFSSRLQIHQVKEVSGIFDLFLLCNSTGDD